MKNSAVLFVALMLVFAACSDSSSTETTAATTTSSSTTTTTLVPPTSSTSSTSEATTTTTEPEDTTTTSEATGETSTTTTTRVDNTSTTTTEPPPDADPDLVQWAGLFRQPTSYKGFLEFQANGVMRAGTAVDALNISGTWDYDDVTAEFTFTDFDFGAGCDGAAGVYKRQTADGGGRRILLVDDPCTDRVNFITQPGSSCQCFLWLRVDEPEE